MALGVATCYEGSYRVVRNNSFDGTCASVSYFSKDSIYQQIQRFNCQAQSTRHQMTRAKFLSIVMEPVAIFAVR